MLDEEIINKIELNTAKIIPWDSFEKEPYEYELKERFSILKFRVTGDPSQQFYYLVFNENDYLPDTTQFEIFHSTTRDVFFTQSDAEIKRRQLLLDKAYYLNRDKIDKNQKEVNRIQRLMDILSSDKEKYQKRENTLLNYIECSRTTGTADLIADFQTPVNG